VIHQGDLFDVLPTLAAGSIDACVTDPPYGIGFMGREWDTFAPAKARASKQFAIGHGDKGRKDAINPNLRGRRQSPAMSPSQIEYNRTLEGQRGFQDWTAQWASEVLRVLKPGAYVVVCGAPRSHHRMMCGLEDAGFEIKDCLAWICGQGFPKNYDLGDGKGTALKPAQEPIALAWKPFRGTIKACHAQHGTAALNIDACRVEVTDGDYTRNASGDRGHAGTRTKEQRGSTDLRPGGGSASDIGRWPANVILDEEAAAALDEQSGDLVSGPNPTRRMSDKVRNVFGEFKGQAACDAARGLDVGGASRFFYCAKPSREERDLGLDENGNIHPTVKPVALMRWLVRLITPVGGLVLDPFTGSGTTGMACGYEHRRFIGVEREPDYILIATRRISAVAPLFSEEATA
jgi:DNA modification methylase